MKKLIYSFFLLFLFESCNESFREQKAKAQIVALKIDSINKVPVLNFLNANLEKSVDSKVKFDSINLTDFEASLEKIKWDSSRYFTFKSYCAYFKGNYWSTEQYASKALLINDANFLAESILLFNTIIGVNYDSVVAMKRQSEIKAKYPNDELGELEKCINALTSFHNNPSKFLR